MKMEMKTRNHAKNQFDLETLVTYGLVSSLLAIGSIGLIASMFEISFNKMGLVSFSALVIGLTGIIWTFFVIHHLSK